MPDIQITTCPSENFVYHLALKVYEIEVEIKEEKWGHLCSLGSFLAPFQYCEVFNIIYVLYNAVQCTHDIKVSYCYFIFFQVNEEGFKGCFLPPQHIHYQKLVDCDNPSMDIKFTFEFKRFSGVPGGKDFLPGNNYYLASK